MDPTYETDRQNTHGEYEIPVHSTTMTSPAEKSALPEVDKDLDWFPVFIPKEDLNLLFRTSEFIGYNDFIE